MPSREPSETKPNFHCPLPQCRQQRRDCEQVLQLSDMETSSLAQFANRAHAIVDMHRITLLSTKPTEIAIFPRRDSDSIMVALAWASAC